VPILNIVDEAKTPKVIIKGLPRAIVETHEEFGDTYVPADPPIATNSFTFEGQMAARTTAMVGAKNHLRDKRFAIRWASRLIMLCVVFPLAGWLIMLLVGVVKSIF
jgi:hypothetical protein